MCAHAARRPAGDVVAVALAAVHARRAASLLFGTGIGVVATMGGEEGDLDLGQLVGRARRSVAAGATEISMQVTTRHGLEVVAELAECLPESTLITVDVTSVAAAAASAAVDTAGRALGLGADYISLTLDVPSQPPDDAASAFTQIAGKLGRQALKVAASSARQAMLLVDSPAVTAGVARLQIPVERRRSDLGSGSATNPTIVDTGPFPGGA